MKICHRIVRDCRAKCQNECKDIVSGIPKPLSWSMGIKKLSHLLLKGGGGDTRNLNSARMVATTCKLLLMNGFRSYSLHSNIITSFFILTAFSKIYSSTTCDFESTCDFEINITNVLHVNISDVRLI